MIRKTRGPPTGWARKKAAPPKFDPKPSAAAFSAVFYNSDSCRPEVASVGISTMFVRLTVPDEYVKFRGPILNQTFLEKFNPKLSEVTFSAVFRTSIHDASK